MYDSGNQNQLWEFLMKRNTFRNDSNNQSQNQIFGRRFPNDSKRENWNKSIRINSVYWGSIILYCARRFSTVCFQNISCSFTWIYQGTTSPKRRGTFLWPLEIKNQLKIILESQSRNSMYKGKYLHRNKHIISVPNCTLIILEIVMTKRFIFLVFIPNT
jgi:hypothetical protein